jgi:hypothetical protein
MYSKKKKEKAYNADMKQFSQGIYRGETVKY